MLPWPAMQILSEYRYNTVNKALELAERGFEVFPLHGSGICIEDMAEDGDPNSRFAHYTCTCVEGMGCENMGKHPRTPGWQRSATRDADRIRSMDWQDSNIGVSCAGLTVVDVDPRNGGGRDWLEETDTLTVQTGGGGWHFYFRGETRTCRGLSAGIDIKSGIGGYVVGPGSKDYKVVSYGEYLEPVPDWLRVRIERPKADTVSLVKEQILGHGERDNGLTAIGGLLRRYGFSASETEAALLAVNAERCDPPLPAVDVKRIAESVSRYAIEASIKEIAHKRISGVLDIDGILGLQPPKYEIETVWPEGGVNVLFGKPGTLKSFLALEWSLHRSIAADWHGFEIAESVKTLYVAAEGVFGMGSRLRTILAGHGLSVADLREQFFMYPGSVNILNAESAEFMYEYLAENAFELVIFDTLRKSMTGGDENNTQDIGQLMSMLESWSLEGISSLLLHHANRAGSGHRGSSAIEGDAYNMWEMSRNRRDLRTKLKPTKFKDADDAFQLNIDWEERSGSLVSVSAERDSRDEDDVAEIGRNFERNIEIRAACASGESQTSVGARFGLTQQQISRIVRGEL